MNRLGTRLLSAVFWLLALCASHSHAENVIIDETSPISIWFVDRLYFIDESSKLSAAQVALLRDQFQEVPDEPFSGARSGKYWRSFTIENKRGTQADLFLTTFIPTICTAHLIDPEGRIRKSVATSAPGVNHYAKRLLDEERESDLISRYPAFSVSANSSEVVLMDCNDSYWGRSVAVFELAPYLEATRAQVYLEGLLLGAIVFMALVGFFSAAINRDRTMLVYALWLVLTVCALLTEYNDGTRLQEFIVLTNVQELFGLGLAYVFYAWSSLLFALFCYRSLGLSALPSQQARLDRLASEALKWGMLLLAVVLLIPLAMEACKVSLSHWFARGWFSEVWSPILSDTDWESIGSNVYSFAASVDLGLRFLLAAFSLRLAFKGNKTSRYIFFASALYFCAQARFLLMNPYVPNIGMLELSSFHIGILLSFIHCLIGLVMAFAVTVRNKEIKDAFEEQVRTRQAFMEEQNQVLEQRVKERTHELMLQTEKTERLMLNILPAPIAERLKRGEPGISDSHASVSILFSDLVGFTALSSKRSADEVVKLLNDLFSRFDIRAKSLGLEKIKTIGDAYMVAGGIPQADDRHAELVTTMALGMREDLRAFNEENGTDIAMRIGINSGSVIAGVIGHTKFSYDLWGNTVNAASRMESTCEVGQIQVSASTFALIKNLFTTRERGFVECKGLGPVKTFFVDQALQQL
jgi:class 3 adenylate cyclase